MYYLFVFRSLTATKQGARTLAAVGIPATVVKNSMSVSDDGCSYAVKVASTEKERAEKTFAEKRMEPVKIYALEGRSSAGEVRL